MYQNTYRLHVQAVGIKWAPLMHDNCTVTQMSFV